MQEIDPNHSVELNYPTPHLTVGDKNFQRRPSFIDDKCKFFVSEETTFAFLRLLMIWSQGHSQAVSVGPLKKYCIYRRLLLGLKSINSAS